MLKLTHSTRRSSARIEANCSVWVRNGNGTFHQVSLTDISEDGAGLQWDTPNVSGEVHLVIKLREGSYLSLQTQLAWQTADRVGLKFQRPVPSLDRFVSVERALKVARSVRVMKRSGSVRPKLAS